MDVEIREDLERLVSGCIQSGRYTREDVMRAIRAWLHEHDAEEESEHPAAPQPMTDEEFRQHLLRTGRISQLPTGDWKGRRDDAWKPIPVEGEPVSQTIIRERR